MTLNDLYTHNGPYVGLFIALLLGLLIGAQRGWVLRDRASGQRIAGIRTHALISLYGGCCALLAQRFSAVMLGAGLLALTIIGCVGYVTSQKSYANISITTLTGMLLTFCFGALAVMGEHVLAAVAAVITTIILDNKSEIHGFINKLQEHELDAALKLLLISVVMLPLLPNQGFGPWNAINPYETWWMVVLIASISFAGYFAVKLGGAEKGIIFTSLFAGLSSSTALTLHFSRLSRDNPSLSPMLSSGILAACGTMFPRILLVCSVINPALTHHLWLPILTMSLLTYLPALGMWYMHHRHNQIQQPELKQNPLEISSALFFGFVLMLIMLLSHWLQEWLGQTGVYLLAAFSGLSDVDAISLSLGRLSLSEISIQTAVLGIILAASVNSLVKAGMAISIGGRGLGLRVGATLSTAVSTGLLVSWLISGAAGH
ncbi:MAG: MgtC/SapB family protein [Hahellaceae bacterium]|nr:MgtC/SapB family protein [Hahellaceae bacterium]MCP5168432.1 MgtC/SapB family protein [Hahellaceae bacterium]